MSIWRSASARSCALRLAFCGLVFVACGPTSDDSADGGGDVAVEVGPDSADGSVGQDADVAVGDLPGEVTDTTAPGPDADAVTPDSDVTLDDTDAADATEVSAGDATADTAPDVTEPPQPLTLTLLELESICFSCCSGILSKCGASTPVGNADQCQEACVEAGGVSPASMINWMCFNDQCDATECKLTGEPFEADPDCDALCAVAVSCDALELIGMKGESENVCRLRCAADAAVGGPAVNLAPCVTKSLQDACDKEAAAVCLSGGAP
ncbi:MAG: hypothetical protein R3F39_07635 [Myxococcota bacterium]